MSVGKPSGYRSALLLLEREDDDIVRYLDESLRLIQGMVGYTIHRSSRMNQRISMVKVKKKINRNEAVCICTRCSKDYTVKYIHDANKSPVGDLCLTCKRAIADMAVTKDNVRAHLNYDELTGSLSYRHTTISGKAGESATKEHGAGYLKTRLGGKDYLVHRIAFMYMEGRFPDQVDHIDHNRSNNVWSNLRDVNNKVNSKNHSKSEANTTGITGVAVHKPTGKYRAYIGKDYKQIHLGLFETLAEAKEARDEANKVYTYHSNHGV